MCIFVTELPPTLKKSHAFTCSCLIIEITVEDKKHIVHGNWSMMLNINKD